MSERWLVAMSGGVDSSVAAALLAREGHEVFGVTMDLGEGTSLWGQPYGSPLDAWVAWPFVALLGPGVAALRFPVFLLGLALVPLAYGIGRALDPRAAFPGLSYYFRDFTVTFYPIRLFAAQELRAGRLAFWNPYFNEGAFALPVLYPLDLLHAFFSSPEAVSWLLTLHFPLAALAMYVLARDLEVGRLGAFLAGALYSLGGLALSSLNLYVFLQALAWAPLVAATLRRAAIRGWACCTSTPMRSISSRAPA